MNDAPPVHAIVPMLHVTDLPRSVEFYRLLDFDVGNYEPREGPIEWAWLYAPKATDWKRGPNLMLVATAAFDQRRWSFNS
jgi:hypothetical protein